MIDWDDVRVFLAVADFGSIAGAARGLGMSHATVWRRVRSLEAAVGAEVFVRAGNVYSLSPAGSILRERYAEAGKTITQGVEEARSRSGCDSGVVRVTGPFFLGDVIAERLSELATLSAGLVLELIVDSPVAATAGADVDLAISVEPGVMAGFVCEAMFEIGFSLCASPDYLREKGAPASVRDLSGHRLIDFDTSIRHVGPPSLGAARASGPEIAWRCNSPQARRAAARAGLGLIIAPDATACADPALVCVEDSRTVGSVPVWLHVNADRRRSPRVLVARDFLQRCLDGAAADGARRSVEAAARARAHAAEPAT